MKLKKLVAENRRRLSTGDTTKTTTPRGVSRDNGPSRRRAQDATSFKPVILDLGLRPKGLVMRRVFEWSVVPGPDLIQ